MHSNSLQVRWSGRYACQVFYAICYRDYHEMSVSDRWEICRGFNGQADLISSFVFHAFRHTPGSRSALEIEVMAVKHFDRDSLVIGMALVIVVVLWDFIRYMKLSCVSTLHPLASDYLQFTISCGEQSSFSKSIFRFRPTSSCTTTPHCLITGTCDPYLTQMPAQILSKSTPVKYPCNKAKYSKNSVSVYLQRFRKKVVREKTIGTGCA